MRCESEDDRDKAYFEGASSPDVHSRTSGAFTISQVYTEKGRTLILGLLNKLERDLISIQETLRKEGRRGSFKPWHRSILSETDLLLLANRRAGGMMSSDDASIKSRISTTLLSITGGGRR